MESELNTKEDRAEILREQERVDQWLNSMP